MSQALKDSFNGFSKVQRLCGISSSESLSVLARFYVLESIAYRIILFSTDPRKWSKEHVQQWLHWVSSEFSLTSVNFYKFDMNGQELCDMGKDGFLDLAPDFVGDILWEHLDQMMRGVVSFSLSYANVFQSF